VMHIRHSG